MNQPREMISGAHTRKQSLLLGQEQEGRGGVTNTDELSGGLSHPCRKVGNFLALPQIFTLLLSK